tara:strand:- start:624 stop:1115 length:492 start_codon:yes stop_codon:yes gene_type:complete
MIKKTIFFMNNKYINIYNNLIKLTTNKKLYNNILQQDTFSDRLILFLIHFAFFLKIYKNEKNSVILQEIYDFVFKQLELSIREIGYGDQSINKKMKDYLNLFHSIVSEVHFWTSLSYIEKQKKISSYLDNFSKIDHLVEYFDDFHDTLSKKTLNSYLKSVNNP